MNCFYIVNKSPIGSKETYVGEIDGDKTATLSDFLKEIGIAFKFPDYFGNNLDALDECINDLSWIDQSSYILYIKNYVAFLKDEALQTKLDTLSLLSDACNQWGNVPNFEGEDDFRRKADFKIYVEQCGMIESDLRSI